MRGGTVVFIALAALFLNGSAAADVITGKVIGISDGDTLTLLINGNQQVKVRLEGIDAPENGQEYAAKSKQGLSSKVFGETVRLRANGKDRYGRTLGVVYFDQENVNRWLVKEGLAWHYTKYSDDRELAAAQTEAKNARKGLWSGFRPMPPWEYRALGKSSKTTAKSSPESSSTQSGATPKAAPAASYWLNSSSGVRHNRTCRWFGKTKRGRFCTKSDGRACGICGG